MNRPKPINLDTAFEVALVLLVAAFLIWSFGLSHPLDRYLPDFDAEAVTSCTVSCHSSEVTPPLTVKHIYSEYSFEPGTEELAGLFELLEGTKYRRHFSNILPDDHSRSITIDTSAEIQFVQNGVSYEFNLYGSSMEIGSPGGLEDYSPRGGKAFQESVVAYVIEHGALTEINEY